MWSISVDDEVIIQSDKTDSVAGPMADALRGMLLFQDEIPISPIGPTITLPPKNELEWFAIAHNYVFSAYGGKKKITYNSPPGFDKYMRPGGPDAVY